MLLSVFTRHSTGCRFSRDRACRRCNCSKWVGGQVNGYYFRQSARTRQWAEAEELRLKTRRRSTQRGATVWASTGGDVGVGCASGN